MDCSRISPVFALVAALACASRPTPAPRREPVESSTFVPANAVVEAPASESPPSGEPAPPAAASPEPSAAPDPNDPTMPAPPAAETELTAGVQAGTIAVSGQLHATRVEAAMRRTYPAIRECHEKALDAGTLEDKPVRVQLNFEITEQGRITKLTDDTANLNPLVSSCILRAVLTVTFRAPKSGVVRVTYPIVLKKP
ncbi:MAG TPA: AgmX/PglI C-terminal domain-containing protein [Polyangiaceae bacterium]